MILTATDIANMQECAQGTMSDTCIIQSQTKLPGKEPGGGQYTDAATSTQCGLNTNPANITARFGLEAKDGSAAPISDARVRFPVGTDITSKNRIKVTHRFGTLLDTPDIYAIQGEPRRGVSALVCICTRAVGNSKR